MVVTVATFSLLGLAYAQIVNANQTPNRIAGWLLMIALAVVLGLTAQYWRRWFFVLPGYFGIRSSLGLLLGWFSPKGFVFVAFPVLMFAMGALSFRFSETPKLRAVDRAVLLFATACMLAAMFEMFTKELGLRALLLAGLGDLALLLSRIGRTRKLNRRAESDSTPAAPQNLTAH